MTSFVDKAIGWCAVSAIGAVLLGASSNSFAGDVLVAGDADALIAEFQAACVATDADLGALQVLAEKRGWSPSGPITDGNHKIGAGWRYQKDGRRFTVGATSGVWERGDEPGMRGRPMRDCMVMSDPDRGALEGMTTLYGRGCPSRGDVPGYYRSVKWTARGEGYAVVYSYSETSNRGEARTNSLSVITAGSGPAFTNLDMRGGC